MPTNNSALGTVLGVADDMVDQFNHHPTLWVQAASLIYQRITAPNPLSNTNDPRKQDYQHYKTLCTLRRKLDRNREIPKEWVLDDQRRPQFKTNFADNAEQILQYADDVSQSDYPQKNIVSSMVARISELFGGLSRRWRLVRPIDWHNYRDDGFEVMFFSDLALWLSVELPRYDVKNEKTLEMVRSLIHYCHEVQEDVLFFRNDESEHIDHVPKVTLAEIIEQLEVLHECIEKACKAAAFNDKINRINSNFLDMFRNMFEFLYLLIDDVNSEHFFVDVFLKHDPHYLDQQKKPFLYNKIQVFSNYLTGKWINATLRQAGINSNTFENKHEIDLAIIRQHLVTDYSDLNDLKTTGLWSFARSNREQALEYLNEIAELHRLLLTLCHTRHSILMCARVSNAFGEAWVYGEDEGVETVNLLLEVLENVSTQLVDGIAKFWKKFYTDDFVANNPGIDLKDKCHVMLRKAIKRIERIKDYQTVNTETMNRIRDDMRNAHNDIETAREEAVVLRRKLQDFKEKSGMGGNSQVIVLPQATSIPITAVVAGEQASSKSFAIDDERRNRGFASRLRSSLAGGPSKLGRRDRSQDRSNIQEEYKKAEDGQIVNGPQATNETSLTVTSLAEQERNQNRPEEEEYKVAEDGQIVNGPQSTNETAVIATSIHRQYRERELHCFEVARHIVDSVIVREETYSSWMNTSLFNKPENFHSPFQEKIYNEFLVANNWVVTLPWQFSFMQNISAYKIRHLTDLYMRVNGVMRMLYLPNNMKNELLRPKQIEIILIDTLLQDTINAKFKEYQFYNYHAHWEKEAPYRAIPNDENGLDIELDLFKLTIPRQELAASKLFQLLKHKEALISTLEFEKNKLKEKLDLREKELGEARETIAARDEEIAQEKTSHADTLEELSATKQELAHTKEELARMYALFLEQAQRMQKSIEDDSEEESSEDTRSHTGVGPGFFQQGPQLPSSSTQSNEEPANSPPGVRPGNE